MSWQASYDPSADLILVPGPKQLPHDARTCSHKQGELQPDTCQCRALWQHMHIIAKCTVMAQVAGIGSFLYWDMPVPPLVSFRRTFYLVVWQWLVY